MKKTSVRFATVGTVLVLGALALALAQHDARQRVRELPLAAKTVSEAPQPLLVDDSRLAWVGQSAAADESLDRVRGNDQPVPPSLETPSNLPASGNPLRSPVRDHASVSDAASSLASLVPEGSSVILAGGELPGTSPPSPNNLGAPPALPPSLAAMPSGPTSGASPRMSVPPPPSLAMPTASLAGGLPSALAANDAAPSLLAPPATLPTELPNTAPKNFPSTSSSSNQLGSDASNIKGAALGQGMTPTSAPPSLTPATPGNSAWSSPADTAFAPTTQSTAPTATLGTPQPSSPLGSNSGLGSSSGLGTSGAGRSPVYTDATTQGGSSGHMTTSTMRGASAAGPVGSLVSNVPGQRHLDGSQNPIMLIHRRTAGECQVGKRLPIVITVRNSGNATAHDVEVIDSIPSGASFAEAVPAVTPGSDGLVVWRLGEMGPGDERTIQLHIVPEREGELGSTAVVRFASQASVRTLATRPKLELAFTSASEVLIGSQHSIDVVVKNVGSGAAQGVRLEADLPKQLRHESSDASLEASFGSLAPGESKQIRLDAIAAEPGAAACSLRALTEDGLQQEKKVDLRVLSPQLQASLTGPSRRYLDRQATFEVMLKNVGTAAATQCEFVMRLPAGLNFNTATKNGTYDPAQHAVFWSLPEFPAGAADSIELTVLPVEVGNLTLSFQGSGDLGVRAEARGSLVVEEQGELAFTIEQDADPIELSASTTYTVDVRNVGRADRNVQLSIQLPAGSQVLKVDAPVKGSAGGDGQLVFEPIGQMDSGSHYKFRFEVRHGQIGTQVVRAQLRSQNRPTPVIKEEATDVYNDRN